MAMATNDDNDDNDDDDDDDDEQWNEGTPEQGNSTTS